MSRFWFVLAILARVSWGQAPAYTAASIVNASDYSAGPFAPNSVLTIFGTNLSWSTQSLSLGSGAARVPSQMAGVQVYVDQYPAPLLYVSGPQINFLIPSSEIAGNITVRVVREGVRGPDVTLTLVDSAPALFDTGSDYAIATHLDGSLLSDTSPAEQGEMVVVYATGLGATHPNPPDGEIPQSAASIKSLASLTVSLDGAPLPADLIKYAGVTPESVGLYQFNIQLPGAVGPNPVIQVSVGGQSSAGTPKIAVR